MTTLAGSSTSLNADGFGTSATFTYPIGTAVDTSGNILVTDANTIRKVTPLGAVSTVTGSATSGYVDGLGTTARFNSPKSLTIATTGVIYVTDTGNNRIRVIDTTGSVTTLSGSSSTTFADGRGTKATFNSPVGIGLDISGNLYVADYSNCRIRLISASTKNVTTFAGSGTCSWLDGVGTSARFYNPQGLAVTSSGTVYVTDYGNSRLRAITSAAVVTTLAGSSASNADGIGTSAYFNFPSISQSVAVDTVGNIYVTDGNNNKIRIVSSVGYVTTLAGSASSAWADGTKTSSSFYTPAGVAVDTNGYVYVSDYNNHRVRRIVIKSQGKPVHVL